MREFMKPIREALSGAVESTKQPEESGASERIADRLRLMVWPERAMEVKKERARLRVREEALDGAE